MGIDRTLSQTVAKILIIHIESAPHRDKKDMGIGRPLVMGNAGFAQPLPLTTEGFVPRYALFRRFKQEGALSRCEVHGPELSNKISPLRMKKGKST
jgi:hypothetical protein